MSEPITVYDEYNQPWRIEESNPLYKEAVEAADAKDTYVTNHLVWPLAKITADRGWGWWSVFKKLDDLEAELEKQIPNPSKQRLIDISHDYSPVELENLLQAFSSYLSSLDAIEGRYDAQSHALKQGLKTGLDVAVTRLESKETTISAREAQLLGSQPVFADARKLQIEQEAMLKLIQGWRKSYEDAYTGISRIISLRIGEAGLTPARAQ